MYLSYGTVHVVHVLSQVSQIQCGLVLTLNSIYVLFILFYSLFFAVNITVSSI